MTQRRPSLATLIRLAKAEDVKLTLDSDGRVVGIEPVREDAATPYDRWKLEGAAKGLAQGQAKAG